MAGVRAILVVLLAAATAIGAFANDPDMLQDVCVADRTSGNCIVFGLANALCFSHVIENSTGIF